MDTKKPITNLVRPDDGFGENYKYIIYSLMYAELNGLDFVYTPFKIMQHNYDEDPDYIPKKEKMINIIGHFKSDDDHTKLNIFDLLQFYHKNIEWCSKSRSLDLVKTLFYLDKVSPFDNSRTNIAIHIRRMNRHDYIVVDEGTKLRTPVYDELFERLAKDPITANRLPGMDVPVDLYTTIIGQLEQIYPNPQFHIFSQGNVADFKIFERDNTVLHINECLETTFLQLVYADVLVTAPSALSYTAGLISNNTIYYVQCLNPPLPHWNVIQNYQSSKMRHKFSSINNDDLKVTDFTYDPLSNTFERIL